MPIQKTGDTTYFCNLAPNAPFFWSSVDIDKMGRETVERGRGGAHPTKGATSQGEGIRRNEKKAKIQLKKKEDGTGEKQKRTKMGRTLQEGAVPRKKRNKTPFSVWPEIPYFSYFPNRSEARLSSI